MLLCLAINGLSQVVFNGNITEPEWGAPLGSSIGGPSPCLGNGLRLNSLFASANDSQLLLGIGGNVQPGNAILVFVDSKPGGYSTGNFGRDNAPAGLSNFNSNIIFDDGFQADYCLSISANQDHSDYFFNLFALGGNSASGGGINTSLGSALNNAGIIGTNTADNDNTKGFEIALARDIVGFDAAAQTEVKMMAMIISDAGHLDNQFLSNAKSGEACYGNTAIDFRSASPNPIVYSPDQLLPIVFTQLSFVQRNTVILLKWSSASELNMQQYELERSDDAIGFVKIGTVKATGNNSAVSNYEFPDFTPSQGKNFYRVKAVDKSGRAAYSPVVKVQFGYVDNTLGIFPNPVTDNINLQLIGLTKGKYSLVIYNDAGQRVMFKTIEYNGGYGLQQIPLLPNMTAGPYRLLLTNKSVFYKQNFLVRRPK